VLPRFLANHDKPVCLMGGGDVQLVIPKNSLEQQSGSLEQLFKV
jgi:hypothetical protein